MNYYHYTNEDAYKNIKRSGVLRFSQLGLSNDKNDCRYASFDLYERALYAALKHDETDLISKKYIQCILENNNNYNLYRNMHSSIYGVCLCEDSNNEKLIKSYGSFVIKIDFNAIKEIIQKSNPGCPTYWLKCNKVVYNEEEYIDLVRKILIRQIRDRKFYVEELLKDITEPNEIFETESWAIKRASEGIYSSVFSESSILYKSKDWHEEREIRMYIIENTYEDHFLNFYNCVDSSKFISYIKDIGLHSSLKVSDAKNNKEYYEFKIEKFRKYITF